MPFFVAKPDENLVSYVERGLLPAGGGRALDLGCGPGRNSLHLASLGYEVDAVDLSPTAVRWAEERAREAGATGIRFVCGDAFAPGTALDGPYDLVYDSGCFHHLPPHRRIGYLALLDRVLAPGGHFALTTFAAGEGGMGSELPDADFYRKGALDGGLAYTDDSLRAVFADLTDVEVRRMRDESADSPPSAKPSSGRRSSGAPEPTGGGRGRGPPGRGSRPRPRGRRRHIALRCSASRSYCSRTPASMPAASDWSLISFDGQKDVLVRAVPPSGVASKVSVTRTGSPSGICSKTSV